MKKLGFEQLTFKGLSMKYVNFELGGEKSSPL